MVMPLELARTTAVVNYQRRCDGASGVVRVGPSSSGAVMASPSFGEPLPSLLPRSPAPITVSVVEADEPAVPPTMDERVLAIVAKKSRPLAAAPSLGGGTYETDVVARNRQVLLTRRLIATG